MKFESKENLKFPPVTSIFGGGWTAGNCSYQIQMAIAQHSCLPGTDHDIKIIGDVSIDKNQYDRVSDFSDACKLHVAGQTDIKQPSLINEIATDAKTNISAMKVDVDSALHETQMSYMHLQKYQDFIQKKRKQRLQCIRDMQIHCCQCDGPHISKPPFRHGKDYRRDLIHNQYQSNDCLFLKKKQSELDWLDTTLGDYSKNNEQYELEIEKCKAETKSRKENLKDALANSLRLMEIASDSLESYPHRTGIPESERTSIT